MQVVYRGEFLEGSTEWPLASEAPLKKLYSPSPYQGEVADSTRRGDKGDRVTKEKLKRVKLISKFIMGQQRCH